MNEKPHPVNDKKFSEFVAWYQAEHKKGLQRTISIFNSFVEADFSKRKKRAKALPIIFTPLLSIALVLSCIDWGDDFSLIIRTITSFVSCSLLGLGIYRIYTIDEQDKLKAKIYLYHKTIKKNLLPQMISYLHPNFTIEPKVKLAESDFIDSRLFDYNRGHYTGEDLVKGYYDNVKLKFCEIDVFHKLQKDELKDCHQGIFLIANFNKRLKHQTLVIPQIASFHGLMTKQYSKGGGKRVKLENPTFEKHFEVFGTDGIESRYVLSSSFMEKLVEYKEKLKKDIAVSFIDSRMYLTIESSENHFDWDAKKMEQELDNAYKSNTKLEFGFYHFEQDFLLLQFLIGIVEHLDLNVDIWAKN